MSDLVKAQAERINELTAALRALVERCDGPEGVREDGSNIDTLAAHAALGDFVCPHGNTGECNECDILGDIAFDAAREARVFGRR